MKTQKEIIDYYISYLPNHDSNTIETTLALNEGSPYLQELYKIYTEMALQYESELYFKVMMILI